MAQKNSVPDPLSQAMLAIEDALNLSADAENESSADMAEIDTPEESHVAAAPAPVAPADALD